MVQEIPPEEWGNLGKKPPFTVLLIDTTDAYYYADVFDENKLSLVDRFEKIEKANAVADALFIIKNYQWESLSAMNEQDGGYDVRIYDAYWTCVYRAYEKYKEKWIGEG